MTLSIPQIIAVAQAAGFTGDDLVTAVAIALAESNGGDPNAYNPETQAHAPVGKGSYGLWQIYLNAHPEFAGENLYDPQTNAAAAYAVYAGAGSTFRLWSTFGSGKYLSYTDAVSAAINPPAQDVVASTDGGDGGDGGSDGGAPPVAGPSGTEIATIAVAGLLAVWGAIKLFG